MKRLYFFVKNKILLLSSRKGSIKALYIITFFDGFVLPVPHDLVYIPVIASNKNKARTIILFTTLFSVMGGILGYMLGYILSKLFSDLSLFQNEIVKNFNSNYSDTGLLAVFLGCLTAMPYKFVVISSGILKIDLMYVIPIITISRSIRLSLIGYLTVKFGQNFLKKIEKNLSIIPALGIFLLAIIVFFKIR